MDVVTPAASAASIIEKHGVLGVVVLFASLLAVALLALWRDNRRLRDQLDKTSQWAFGEVAKNVEISRLVSTHMKAITQHQSREKEDEKAP
jgi:hypothetical protein